MISGSFLELFVIYTQAYVNLLLLLFLLFLK